MKLARWLTPLLWIIALVALGLGLWASLTSPIDYQQGLMVRMMFIHVPSAWMSLFIYVVLAVCSAVSLIFRHPLSNVAARSCAMIGMCFTLITLITGAIWGKPIWGVWWVWDARLTSELILFFIYLGYIAIWSSIPDERQAGFFAAIMAVVGVVNIPIIKFSVDWWHSLHQPASISRFSAPAIHSDFLFPLLMMAFAFHILFFALWLTKMQATVYRQRLLMSRLKIGKGYDTEL